MSSDRRRHSLEHVEKMRKMDMIMKKEEQLQTVAKRINTIYENDEDFTKAKLLARLEKQEEDLKAEVKDLKAEVKEMKESIGATSVKRRRSMSPLNLNFDEKNAGDNDDEETPWQNNLNIERDNDSHLI